MRLFKIFNKKTPLHDEKLRIAYCCYKPEMVRMIFPGGIEQADKVVISLGKVYQIDLESSDAKKYYEILTTYSDILIRRVVTHSSDNQIIASLMVNNSEIIKNKDTAKQALAYVTISMKNNDFALVSDDDINMLLLFANAIASEGEVPKEDAVAEERNMEDPEYGLVSSKPIYTQGVSGSNSYLQSLQTALGEQLKWNRCGSISVEGIKGVIDIYESTLPSGKPYKTLYLNMYGSANSTKIPKGFKKANI